MTYPSAMSNRLIPALSLTLVAALAAACAPASEESDQPDRSQSEDLAASTMLSAEAGGTTVRLERTATLEVRDGRGFAVVRGSASRDLDAVFSFVPDDAFGTASLLTKRKFEVLLELGSELNSIASGLPLIVRVTPKNTSKPTVFAHFVLMPELSHFSGASALRFDQDVRPVYLLGEENPLRYRGAISATSALTSVAIDAGANDPAVARIDADTFRFDWTYDALQGALETRIAADAVVASGAHKAKSAELGLGVRGLEATTEDPYDTWPSTCDADVWHCIDDARTAGANDLGHCGDYREVQHCIYADAPSDG